MRKHVGWAKNPARNPTSRLSGLSLRDLSSTKNRAHKMTAGQVHPIIFIIHHAHNWGMNHSFLPPEIVG